MLTLEYLGPDRGLRRRVLGAESNYHLNGYGQISDFLVKFPTMLTLEYLGPDGEGREGVEACPRGGAELPGGPGPA